MTGSIPAPNAGWYPDPSGRPGQRYFDGIRWTSSFAPPAGPQPSVVVNNHIAAAPVAVAVATRAGTNHLLHFLLTLVTCGLWLPIWIIAAIVGAGRSSSVAVAGGGGAVAVSRGNGAKVALVAGAIFVGLFLMGLIADHPWLLAIIVPTAVAAGIAVYSMRAKQSRDEERQKLAIRAEYEDQLYADGDPRGIHGRFMPPGPR